MESEPALVSYLLGSGNLTNDSFNAFSKFLKVSEELDQLASRGLVNSCPFLSNEENWFSERLGQPQFIIAAWSLEREVGNNKLCSP